MRLTATLLLSLTVSACGAQPLTRDQVADIASEAANEAVLEAEKVQELEARIEELEARAEEQE